MLSIYDVKRLLESKNLPYEDIDNDGLRFTEYNDKYRFRYTVVIFISGDACNILIDTGVQVSYCSNQLYKFLNDLNKEYKYFKFVFLEPQSNDDSYTLFLGHDVYLAPGLTAMDLMFPVLRGLEILEQAYPSIQREVWR